MNLRPAAAITLACVFWAVPAPGARGQWGYPGGGYGAFGWGGWGGAATPQGDMARGMGIFAAGAGTYNKQTAIADSIDADTVKRWNEYLFQSQQITNDRFRRRQEQARATNIRVQAEMQRRLRDNPEPRDIARGSALNVALDEINDPRVYARALQAANVPIGGALVRAIPFQYASAGITVGLHQLASGTLPAPLRRPRNSRPISRPSGALDERLVQQVDDDKEPDPATVRKLLDAIEAAEAKAARILPAKGLDAKQADRFLKSLHGLVTMLKPPPLDEFLAGVEKRPELTLGELLRFMSSFNLRFGPAATAPQRDAYNALYPKLVALREQVSPAPPTPAPKPRGTEAEDFFSAMSYDDLKKAAKP